MNTLQIDTPTITLGQLLQLVGVIETGGQAKWFLQEQAVFVNGEVETRRGRKIKDGDFILVPGAGRFTVESDMKA